MKTVYILWSGNWYDNEMVGIYNDLNLVIEVLQGFRAIRQEETNIYKTKYDTFVVETAELNKTLIAYQDIDDIE
jgi:hypothetical protein